MTDLSPETVGKLVALVRRLRSDFCMSVPLEVLREAQAIVLPEPVDPDEAAVDEIYRVWLGNDESVRGAIVAGIKRGRALAGGGRS